jgi:5'-methylthioadenosine phosphorylase
MIGIIGGSGLDDPKILKNVEEKEVETAYGKPSSPLKIGEIAGKKVCLIARHGRKLFLTNLSTLQGTER